MIGAFQQSLRKYTPRSKENNSSILGIMKDLTSEVRGAVAGARPILPGGIGPIESDKISMIITAAFQLLDDNGSAYNVDPDEFRRERQEAQRRQSHDSQTHVLEEIRKLQEKPTTAEPIEALLRDIERGTLNAETSLRKSIKDLRDEVKENTRRMKYVVSLIENESDSDL
eukprot:g13229.t1